MSQISYARLDHPAIDHLWVATGECGLIAIAFRGFEGDFRDSVEKLAGERPYRDEADVEPALTQLREYLDGSRKVFDLDICWEVMTPFQQASLRRVLAVPYGKLTTYQQIAHELDRPKAIRAVGRANATNPIPLVIPCHRVIGSDGKLRGFGGGLETKARLLRMEGSWLL